MYTYPFRASNHFHDMYSYHEPYFYKAILLEIFSSFILLKELFIAQINLRGHSNEQFPACRTFVSCKHHDDLTAGSFTELWCIGPKRTKATMTTTTQIGI